MPTDLTIDLNALDGPGVQELVDALTESLGAEKRRLAPLVHYSTNQLLGSLVSGDGEFPVVAYELVQALKRKYWLDRFVARLIQSGPPSPRCRAFCIKYAPYLLD